MLDEFIKFAVASFKQLVPLCSPKLNYMKLVCHCNHSNDEEFVTCKRDFDYTLRFTDEAEAFPQNHSFVGNNKV